MSGVQPVQAPAPEGRPGEDALIARVFRPLAGPAALGLRDDAACLTPPPGHDLVVTCDALVAGVHFFADDPAEAIGWKALAVNLSDLAAKGAEPLGFLLALALPETWTLAWLEGFARGLGRGAQEGRCPLMGGDTVRTPGPLTLSVTAIGVVPAGSMVARSGARAGDVVLVSGTIGDGALGLLVRRDPGLAWVHALPEAARAHLVERYLRPHPRLGLAEALRRHAHGGMDISDGLVGDLSKLLAASGVGAAIRLEEVPLSPAATHALQVDPALRAVVMTGGDDYEILCSVPPAALAGFRALAAVSGVAVTPIGEIVAGQDLSVTWEGQPVRFDRASFSHFEDGTA